jgi:ABC-type transporter Mla maintaining outer membrane lipid asymmetry ATPase subunit MlaF
MTILPVDHNVRRVVKMTDCICMMSPGEIIAEGACADFQSDRHEQARSWPGIDCRRSRPAVRDGASLGRARRR